MCLFLLSVFVWLSIHIRIANVCEIYIDLSHRSSPHLERSNYMVEAMHKPFPKGNFY